MNLNIDPCDSSLPATITPTLYRVAVLIPCFNEAIAIADVVRDFQRALPTASIHVYDNNSTDGTADAARNAGAFVRTEREQGKGNVVRRMFSDIDADIYVMVDGDGTYDASAAPRLIEKLLNDNYDMVNVARCHVDKAAYRRGHVVGNQLLTKLVGMLFGAKTTDMLSGYKAFSRRFVKTFPASSRRFEIETEIMIHCLDLRLPVAEIEAPYSKRPEGSSSKLSTFKDGFRILMLLGWLLKHEKPLAFFSVIATLLILSSLVLGTPVLIEFLQTGLVPRLPTALLATGTMLVGFMCLFTGLMLDTVTHSRREMKRLFYLKYNPTNIPSAASISSQVVSDVR